MRRLRNTFAAMFFVAGAITAQEKYGNTLNAGVGLNYYGYRGYTTFAFHANYEIDVAKNFTIAPFISYSTYQTEYYWGNKNYPYRYYHYRETFIPIGVKGSYYFDELLKANEKWDFYGALSLGYTLHKVSWESGYYGDYGVYRSRSYLYLNLHIGAEYHINEKIGIYGDLSTGMSSLGAAIHF